MNNQRRIPRPLGTTLLIRSMNVRKVKDKKKLLTNHLIATYVNQNYTYNGLPYTIEQFCQYLNIELYDALTIISRVSRLATGFLDSSKAEEVVNMVQSKAVNAALMALGKVQSQGAILAKSQGMAYKPFISREVNSILKIELEAIKNLTEISRMLKPEGPKVQILNQQNNNENYLTSEMAIQALEKQGLTNVALNPINLDTLKSLHFTEEMPIIDARLQEEVLVEGKQTKKARKLKKELEGQDSHRKRNPDFDTSIEEVEIEQ